MKILLITKDGDGLGIAHKMASDGHQVKVFFAEKDKALALRNIVGRSSSWRPDASSWADLVIGDMVGLEKFAGPIEQFDVLSLGFNQKASMLELDRQKQMELMNKVGISLPVWAKFSDPDAAEDIPNLFNNKPVVIKPSGNIETGKTQIIKNPDSITWALDQYDADQELVVQEFIEGIEISTEGWFNGDDWIVPFNHTMEDKKFLTGDLGPNTGCMGNVVWGINREDKFVQELKKLEKFLRFVDYTGPIDLNCIANKSGIYGLELTVRFGYDAIEALDFILEDDLGEFLAAVAFGSATKMRLRSEYSVAVRLSIPPYPHGEPSDMNWGKDVPIYGIDELNPHLYLTDVWLDNGNYFWSNVDGVLMKVVGKGRKISSAISQAYKEVSKIEVPNLQYRTDIGARAEQNIRQLKKWGYL